MKTKTDLSSKIPKDLYPFQGHYLNLKGFHYHYLDEGTGEPVVMLHGNPSWSFYYRELVRALRESCRVIVPDHMGCGLSDKPGDAHYSYTLARRVEDLESLITHLNLEDRITLVLHDWGGMIGMTYATRYPERIKRIVLLNTGAFHLPKGKIFPWPLWLCRDTRIGEFLVLHFNAFSRIAAHVCCTRKSMPRAVREAYCAPYEENNIATLRFVQDIPLRPGDAGYSLVTQVQEKIPHLRNLPVLICWGDKDFVFDLHFLREWTRLLPQAEVHRFRDCGHYVLEDAPEEIIPLVKDFIQKYRD